MPALKNKGNIKKLLRHVLKAVAYLSDDNDHCPVQSESVIEQVRYQMRNLVPVANLEDNINSTLKNLICHGLLKKAGDGFSLGPKYAPTQISNLIEQIAQQEIKRCRSEVKKQKLVKFGKSVPKPETTRMCGSFALDSMVMSKMNPKDLPNPRYNLRSNSTKLQRLTKRADLADSNRAIAKDHGNATYEQAFAQDAATLLNNSALEQLEKTTDVPNEQAISAEPYRETAQHQEESPGNNKSQPMRDSDTSGLNLDAVPSVVSVGANNSSLVDASSSDAPAHLVTATDSVEDSDKDS